MIFGIIRDGVRSAFVRIVRYIVFAIIALLVFYIIGIFTNKKASALVYKNALWNPDFSNRSQSYTFWSGNTNAWFDYPFASNWTNNTDYDLIGFHMNRNTMQTYHNSSSTVASNPNAYTITGLIFDTNGTGYMCLLSSQVEDTFLCPIVKGTTYTKFGVNVNVVDNNIDYTLQLDIIVERNRLFYNYESSDIITYFEGNGGLGGMVIEQQETNDLLQDSIDVQTDTNTYIKDNNTTNAQANTTNSLNTVAGQFNDILNGWGGQWSSLTHVVLEPINTILYAFDSNTTCSPITLTIPYLNDGQTITLPCMSSIYGTYFSSFISVFAMIIGGLYGYRTVMYILRTIKEVIDAENDKIEVIDL